MKQAEGVKLEPEPRREIRGLRLPSDVAVNLEAGLGPLRGSGTSGDVHDVEDITIDDKRRKLVVKVFKKARQKERMYDEVYNSVRAKQMVPEGTIEVVGFTHEMGGRAGKCAIVFVDSGQALSEVRDVANDEDWMSYMKQTLSIATTLFRKGMTHNDINPRNLVVNKQGRVTLIDFGSATFADQPGGRSPTSKGPTEHYWCPIARTSSMSKITGITFPSIDGTQNGFTSDAYSCAVSFGEKYDLRVNSIDGVTVPKIDCLDGGLSPAALEEVLRGLTNKANQRWDVTTLEACAWWEEVGNKFCTEVPSITNAERAALALNGSLLRTDRAATMIEAVESAESAADNLEKAIALLQTSMEGRSAAHGEEGAAETTKAVAAMAAVAGGLKKLRQVLVAHAGEGAGSVPRDGTGTNVAPIEVQATARVVTETQRPGKLGRSNRGLHLASGSSKIAVDIPNGDCLGDNSRKRARDGGDPGSGSSTESEPEPPVRRRKIDAPEEKAVRDELSRHAKDDNNAAVVMADPAAMAPQVADPTSIPAPAATVAEESHKSTTQKRARDDSLAHSEV